MEPIGKRDAIMAPLGFGNRRISTKNYNRLYEFIGQLSEPEARQLVKIIASIYDGALEAAAKGEGSEQG